MNSAITKYTQAKLACYTGYITQAAVVNLAPLLFAIFRESYGVSYEMLARIVLINFVVQICADIISIRLARRFSLRVLSIMAHILCAVGFILFSALPRLLSNGYAGILLSTMVYAFGGGMIEVVVNPVIDACDDAEGGEKSPAAIAILHSFYCWGHVLVVLLSTIFLKIFGESVWHLLPLLWAVVPTVNIFIFLTAKMPRRTEESGGLSFRKLFTMKLFLFAALLMLAAGASEQAVAQWASIFAEKGLGVSKTMGDLLGPMCFAVCMAVIRIVAGLLGNKIDTRKLLAASSVLCIISYCIMVFVNIPAVSLIGCSLCGFAVAFMWPGVLSLASKEIRGGGTSMFGALAFFGDLGCSLGPWAAGIASDAALVHSEKLSALPFFNSLDGNQIGLKCGIFAAIIFPVILLCVVTRFKNKDNG